MFTFQSLTTPQTERLCIMATGKLIKNGDVIDWVADADVEAGDMVKIGNVGIGFVEHAAKSGESTTLNVKDIHEGDKVTGAVSLFAPLYFKASVKKLTTDSETGANIFAGFAVKAALSGDARVRIKPVLHP
jgi:predicted RecA/RadA family phage recombinase